MSLRLVEVTAPAEQLEELLEAVGEGDALDLWTVEEGPERCVVRVLLPQERTEELTDRLTDLFEDADAFRLVLLAVEATFPGRDDQEEETSEPSGNDGPMRVSREELYEDLSSGSRVSTVYLVTVVLSSIVAAVGLVRSDVAVIIGAMVIAPLLAPNVALSLAATLGDPKLARRAAVAAVSGAAVALLVSVALGAVVPFDPETPQLLRRSRVGLGDAALALAAGSAGALAYTSGLPTAVIGVMVAVALLPPLVACGLYLGAGLWAPAVGAGLLTLTNLTAINLAGVATFLAQRVTPRRWWEEQRARKARRIALVTWVILLAVLVAMMIWVVGDPEFGGRLAGPSPTGAAVSTPVPPGV